MTAKRASPGACECRIAVSALVSIATWRSVRRGAGKILIINLVGRLVRRTDRPQGQHFSLVRHFDPGPGFGGACGSVTYVAFSNL